MLGNKNDSLLKISLSHTRFPVSWTLCIIPGFIYTEASLYGNPSHEVGEGEQNQHPAEEITLQMKDFHIELDLACYSYKVHGIPL